MPKAIQYGSGSLIYFQGDAAERIYILQNGKVSLIYQDIETGDDVRTPVQPGEFFGVKSALGRYPREENAMSLTDSTVLALTIPEFETMAMSNTRIIMKMLKVFSNQMRRIHAQVSSLMKKEDVAPDVGLFNTGEYYLKNKRYSQAKYVFSRYLTCYPNGKNTLQAAQNLQAAEAALGSADKEKSKGTSAPPASPARTQAAAAKQIDPAKAYYDALSLFSQEKYQEAYQDFKKIVDENTEPEWMKKSSYEMGRCLFFLNKFDECIKYYTVMLTQYPSHPEIRDVMYYIGQSNEKTGAREQAAAFYKKILAMPSPENDGVTTKTRRALETLEG
ncbi:MAG: cyclic nucleotide-binding domain-containing protein [Treponema sp.]|jgi:CRP-like cAMP-binding protein|nr:cyclic nucleotide-binding domain-containing protein [Treponema sp.]